MADFNLNESITQAKLVFQAMSFVKKATLLVSIGAALSVLFFLVELSGKSNYEVLFSNLKTEDTGEIAGALDKLRVPYQIQSATQSILVPSEKVLETRLKLAREGLPRFGGVGFEIFDQKSFGMTEFEQRLNYQRALQGELARTINDIKEIEDTRVHLVIPEKSIFAQSRDVPTASIVVKLSQGTKMPQATVQSIVHLVSASVPNMDASKVTVVDTEGHLLTTDETDESVASFSKKQDVEQRYESKVRELLEPIVGMGKVQVQVTADLDFTSKETTEEKFDPESIAVRSEKHNKVSEKTSGGGVGGAVGAAPTGGGESGKDKNEATESVDYEVSKQVQHVVSPTGEIKKLSVAVIVDGLYTADKDGKQQYAARPPEEIKNYEDLIKSAIGFQTDRGDQLKVMNLAFQNLDELFAQKSNSFWQEFLSSKNSYGFYLSIMINVIIAMIGVLIIMFVVRPVVSAFLGRRQLQGVGGSGGNMSLDQQKQLLLQDKQIKGELQKQALQDPDNMVNVLKSWLS